MGNEQTGADTPAPIATPEEVASGIAEGIIPNMALAAAQVPSVKTMRRIRDAFVSDIAAAIAAERSTSNAEIERLTRERDDAWAAAEAMSADVTDLGAKNTTLTAEVGRMRGLLDEAAGYLEGEGYYTEAGRYRAALSPEPEAKET